MDPDIKREMARFVFLKDNTDGIMAAMSEESWGARKSRDCVFNTVDDKGMELRTCDTLDWPCMRELLPVWLYYLNSGLSKHMPFLPPPSLKTYGTRIWHPESVNCWLSMVGIGIYSF